MNTLLKMIVFISFSGLVNAQEIKKTDLIAYWNIEKYEIASKVYNPTKKDKGNYIFLKGDGSFISQSEGVEEVGKWTLDTTTKTILFTDSKNESIKAKVIKLNNKSLVLDYQVEELKEVLFHYKNTKK